MSTPGKYSSCSSGFNMYDHANTDFMCSIITTDNNTTEQNLADWVNAVGAT